MGNLEVYNALRTPPKEALKKIEAGRMKGKTDINPMWRIKALTEQFGPCGIGWKYTITKQWLEPGPSGEIAAFCDIDLYYKLSGEWSEAVPGTGGSSFVAKEKGGLYVSDECYKMALTDAISVAAKALGVAGDIYWQTDPTKYRKAPGSELQEKAPQEAREEEPAACRDCGTVITDSRKRNGEDWPRAEVIAYSSRRFGRPLCPECQKRAFQAEKAGEP